VKKTLQCAETNLEQEREAMTELTFISKALEASGIATAKRFLGLTRNNKMKQKRVKPTTSWEKFGRRG
jgi:hypothetical protein